VERPSYQQATAFTTSALPETNDIPKGRKVAVLYDLQLSPLMIDHDFGAMTERTYVVKRIDSDFFGEE